MILTKDQIERLAAIINDHATWFTWKIHGEEAVTKQELDRLKSTGLLPMNVSISAVKHAYTLGKLESVLKENEWKNLSWEQLVDAATGRYSEVDKLQIAASELTMKTKFRSLADDLKNNLYHRLQQETRAVITEAEVKGRIKEVIKEGVDMSKTYQRVANDLVETLKEPKRNWTRVADTELHAARQKGVANAISQKEDIYEDAEGDDSLVAVVHDSDACDDCKRIYNGPDGNPKIFKLSELRANEGSNYIRPWRQNAKPVIPPLHPHCYGRLRYIPPGWGWNKDGKFTLLRPKEAYPEVVK